MATYTITTTVAQEAGLSRAASLNGKGLTNTQYLTMIVNSVLDDYVKQGTVETAKERLGLYDRLDAKDKANVDVIFAKAQAAKEAEEAAKVEEPIVEVKEG